MQITVNTQAFAQELRLLNQVAPAKPAIPILSNILITADGGLTLAATDLEIAFRTTCQAQVAEPGTVTLPAKRLLDIVEQLPNIDVSLSTDKHLVFLSAGAFRGRLQTLPADAFPTLPDVGGESIPLDVATLQAMIRRVRYAISDKNKHLMNGALLRLDEGVGALVATDGKRLVVTTMPHTGSTTSVTLPTGTLDALLTMFGDGSLTFSQGERHLFFQSGDRLLVSRTLEGRFPAYERIIPQGNSNVAVVDRVALSAALRRVGLLSEENGGCYLTFAEGGVSLVASSAGAGEAEERVAAHYTGEPLRVCCNWQYLLDFLDAASGQAVTMALKDAVSAVMITDGEHHLGVLMLMRA